MNIFEALRISHETQRALAAQLLATEGDTPERHKIFLDLKRELAAHETAEERCFYIPLMQHDATMDASRHGVGEHHQMDEMVEDLEKTDYSSPGWIAGAKKLSEKIHHHLKDEEQGIFQLAGRILTEGQKTSLAKDYEAEFATHRINPE